MKGCNISKEIKLHRFACQNSENGCLLLWFLQVHILTIFLFNLLFLVFNVKHLYIETLSLFALIVCLLGNQWHVLRKNCPYSELFSSAFFPHFPVFGLKTERHVLSLHIQSECRKMQTRITPNTDTFYPVTSVRPFFDFIIIQNKVLWENYLLKVK